MNIPAPTRESYPLLKSLWHQAFGDPMVFIDEFFETGFSPDRCRCLTVDGQVAAALYWFDAEKDGEKFAYLYAVATEKAHRGQGLCRRLMLETHSHLEKAGYTGAVLVPAEDFLWDYYGTMGYRPFGKIRKFSAQAGTPTPLQEIPLSEYLRLRKAWLPPHSLNEAAAIAFYGTWGKFYRGDACLFAAATDEDMLYVQELLGDATKAPGIVAAFGCKQGNFRTTDGSDPCAMYLMFADAGIPGYLGFPLD